MRRSTGQSKLDKPKVRLSEFPEAGELVTMGDMLLMFAAWTVKYGTDAQFAVQVRYGAVIASKLPAPKRKFKKRIQRQLAAFIS